MKVELDQDSEEWLNFRKSKIGASEIPIIMGQSTYLKPFELLQEKLGFSERQPFTFAMQKGKDFEESIRLWACSQLGLVFIPEVHVHDEHKWASASLDGVCHKNTTLLVLECKYNSKKKHAEAKDGLCHFPHFLQVQWQIFVTNAAGAFYCSYNESLNDFKLVGIEKNEPLIDEIFNDAKKFYDCLNTGKLDEAF